MKRTPSHDAMITAGLNLIQQALSVFDADLKLVLANSRMQQMFDLPDHLVTPGAGFDEVIRFLAERGEYGPVHDLDGFVESRVQLAGAFEAHYMERTRANGRMIAVEGAPLSEGGWVTVYTDITETKQQEALLRMRSEKLSDQVLLRSEELASTNRALAAANAALEVAKHDLTQLEARTRLTAEMMPAHIAHINREERYTFSNRRLRDVIPNRPKDIIGLKAQDALGDEAYLSISPFLKKAFDGEASVFEFTHKPSSRRIRVAFTPDPDTSGIYLLSMDITEETQARVALQQTRRREMATQLTSGLAHDFSNLLTIILGMQSRLDRMQGMPEGADALIATTLNAAKRGGSLLNRIADITGVRELRPVPVDLISLLGDIKVMSDSNLGPDHHLSVAADSLEGSYTLDPGMLQDSLLNLILNARDAMPDGGQITITGRNVQDTWLELEISDTGPGFTADALERGMNPFFTTKGDAGSGLGLAMVYDMIKLSGGETRLFNDNGAHVLLRLPLRVAKAHVPPGLVLLIEDNEDLRASIREMLREDDHTVLEATSVHEAEMLLSTVPEIARVLSDIKLAGTRTGLDVVDLTPLPVTLMTSLPTDDPLYQRASKAAVVLRKPFSTTTLRSALRQSVDQKV